IIDILYPLLPLAVCFGYGYATLVASGGVIGYVKAGSVPSLAAGLLFGGFAGFGAYQVSNDPKNVWVSLAASGALTGIMGKRFYGSRKFMPAGLMAVARSGISPISHYLLSSTTDEDSIIPNILV
uniref:Transmembrane protein 14C n=1 Tax=Haplochromis burtoni TaxID=8153 RepID=A0A3Q2X7Z3_HAPBU